MSDHERRSHAPPQQPEPGRTGRKRWERPDVSRPQPLPSPNATVPEIEEPEEADDFLWLSQAARRDIATARWERGL